MSAYYNHLQLPHGGQRTPSYAKAEMSKLQTLAYHGHNNPTTAKTLVEVWSEPLRIWTKFFEESLITNSRQATTLKGYSQTLQKYLIFLTTRVAPQGFKLQEDDIKILERLQQYQPKWWHSMSKECSAKRSEQLKRDQANLIEIEEMKRVIESSVFSQYRDKLLYLFEAKKNMGFWPKVATRDLTLLRNFLSLQLIVCHAGMSWDGIECNLEEFQDRMLTEDSTYVVNVVHHKYSYSGPQPFFLTAQDIKLFEAYIGGVRSSSEGKHQPYLFFTETGRKVRPSGVSRMLLSFCEVSGAQITKPIHLTAIRKMWVSHMEMSGKSEAEKKDLI